MKEPVAREACNCGMARGLHSNTTITVNPGSATAEGILKLMNSAWVHLAKQEVE
jgi:hypothetical protein